MTSDLNLRSIRLGNNADLTKNFVISTPAIADGTLTISRESGVVVMKIETTGKVTFPFGVTP